MFGTADGDDENTIASTARNGGTPLTTMSTRLPGPDNDSPRSNPITHRMERVRWRHFCRADHYLVVLDHH
jgi:hypothetical protein